MSEFKVEVARVANVQKHPNADTLSYCEVNGYPVIFRTGDFNEGDLAVHIPVDSVVPNTPEWAFLDGKFRIKAKRLRGIFSMGLLSKALPEWQLGQNVQVELGITKYEPPEDLVMGSENEQDPGFIPMYTDIEGLRRYRNLVLENTEVILLEKIHGSNFRTVFHEGRLWVGSRTKIKKFDERNVWWAAAQKRNLASTLEKFPGIVFYGEVYGQVQDLKYDKPSGVDLRVFDAFDINRGRYVNYDEFLQLAAQANLPVVPELYRGPWSLDLLRLSEGTSTMPNTNHVREGFVVKPVIEQWNVEIGRVILKMVGEGYMTRKGG